MKIRFWGVRGSFATPGRDYLRYGGNTTAIEAIAESGARLLIDLGTGATEFAKQLMEGEFGAGRGRLAVLLTHTHLDHIQGLPFFSPFFVIGNQIRILGHEPSGLSLEKVLQIQLDPHYSPLWGLENMAAGVQVEAIRPGSSLAVEGFEVAAAPVPHGSMTCLGYRITADGATVAVITDIEHPDGIPTESPLGLARAADLLVHDATYSDEEYRLRKGWGHSSLSGAIATAERAGAKQLALFHHSPDATDQEIDRRVEQARERTEIFLFAAAEGALIDLASGAQRGG